MPFTHTRRSGFKTELAARLGDTGNVFWTSAELDHYLNEALRTWNALTGYHRGRPTPLATSANDAFYDLEVEYSSLLDYSVTDTDLVTILQYHLLEPAAIPWTGTDMFTLDDLEDALERRRNQFLTDTGRVIAEYSRVAPVGSGRLEMADTIIQVRRAVFEDVDNVFHHLWPEDERNLTAYDDTWSTSSRTPYAYSVTASPPLFVHLAPATSDLGTFRALVVQTGATLDSATGVSLGIPDDFSWVIKWGALADLLHESGQAADARRSEFAQSRYQIGVELAKIAPLVVHAEINGVPTIPDSLANLDAARDDWQNTTGTPDTLALVGQFVAASPVPDGVYSITMDVVRNIPVPSVDADFLQIGREHLDALLDYSVHLASFKMGGQEFESTIEVANRFVTQAMRTNARIAAQGRVIREIAEQSIQDRAERPYEVQSRGLGTAVAGGA